MIITKSHRLILRHLIFLETYDTLRSESGMQSGALRDDLISMINAGLIEVHRTDEAGVSRLQSYDADNLQEFSFRATSKGLSLIS